MVAAFRLLCGVEVEMEDCRLSYGCRLASKAGGRAVRLALYTERGDGWMLMIELTAIVLGTLYNFTCPGFPVLSFPS